MSSKARNHTIDFFRFVFALAIAWLHIAFTNLIEPELDNFKNFHAYLPFLRLGVPFFFAATGYLIGGRKDPHYPLKKARQVGRLFLQLSVIYLLFKCIHDIFRGCFIQDIPLQEVLTEFIQSRYYIGLWNGTFASTHLWYLWALMIGLLLFYWAHKYIHNDNLILLTGFACHLLASCTPLEELQIFKYGGFPEAFFFLNLGYRVSQIESAPKLQWLGFPFALAAYFLSYYLGLDSNSALLQTLLAVCTYYIMFFCHTVTFKDNVISQLGRHYADSIYYFHNIGRDLMPYLFAGFQIPKTAPIQRQFLGFTFSVLLAIPLGKLFKAVNNR